MKPSTAERIALAADLGSNKVRCPHDETVSPLQVCFNEFVVTKVEHVHIRLPRHIRKEFYTDVEFMAINQIREIRINLQPAEEPQEQDAEATVRDLVNAIPVE